MKNPNCDGEHCSYERSQIRILPIPDGILRLCATCYEHDKNLRTQYNQEADVGEMLPLPFWVDLKIYETK